DDHARHRREGHGDDGEDARVPDRPDELRRDGAEDVALAQQRELEDRAVPEGLARQHPDPRLVLRLAVADDLLAALVEQRRQLPDGQGEEAAVVREADEARLLGGRREPRTAWLLLAPTFLVLAIIAFYPFSRVSSSQAVRASARASSEG